ncbi:MAG: archaeosortase/exosortase family protein [Candidatus Methylacidiphilales bacterium]
MNSDGIHEPLPSISRSEVLLSGFLFFVTSFLFAPATLWLLEQTLDYEQLKSAFIVLGLAGIHLMLENRARLRLHLRFGSRAARLLWLSFLVMTLNFWWQSAYLVLFAYCLGLAGWIMFVFGDRLARGLAALMTAFMGFVVLALTVPLFDRPLRVGAGWGAAWLLDLMGYETRLGWLNEADPKLILLMNERAFEVAAECNGFGLISSCLLLVLLLVTVVRIPWWLKLARLAGAVGIGLLFNLIRIVVISLLAGWSGKHYLVMHEVVGILFFWGALVSVWWLWGRQSEDNQEAASNEKPCGVVFFDAECLLCNRSVQMLMRCDPLGRLRFAALQGVTAEEVLRRHPELSPDLRSVLLVEAMGQADERVYLRSTAVLRALDLTGGWRRAARCFLVVPDFLRDAAYDVVSRNRIRWFGRTERCALLTADQRDRLLP